MVPKHRRSDRSSLASVGAPVSTAESWAEVGYGRAGYDGAAAERGWDVASDGDSWHEWLDWQDWGPPPVLHPDHPSAPVPRILLPADHPSGPLPSPRAPRASGHAPSSGRHQSLATAAANGYAAGAGQGQVHREDDRFQRQPGPSRREAVGYQRPSAPGPAPREAVGYQRQPAPGPASRDPNGYQWQAGPRGPEITDYRRETGPLGAGAGSAPAGFHNGHSADADELWIAGQVLTLADDQAAQIAQEAEEQAVAIREAAQRDATAITLQATQRADTITQQATSQAAAIREAAEQEAAAMRARLESMLSELGRATAYVTEGLAGPPLAPLPPLPPGAGPSLAGPTSALPSTLPARPDTEPGTEPDGTALPRRTSALRTSTAAPPGTRPTRPDSRPTGPGTRPPRPTGPAGPGTRPTGPSTRAAGPARSRTAPASKPQRATRQLRAMRIATWGTAAAVALAAIGGATEIGLHGFSFFVFRNGGTGETPGSQTDQQFLSKQATAAHQAAAPKGRHHKTSDQTVQANQN